ncbi:MAG TPA: glycosyltransferase family 2 protein [Crenotrichaceae bacterium]|nr:glycosyltransferase family 2 protein [Crenotrichaceae bacterium]
MSVIIPTYNRQQLLQRSINSILQQVIPASEIIVVDDGSTDTTERMMGSEFPHVIYYKQTRQGVSAARNKGIQLARYPWLAFLDSDDVWLPEKLSRQRQAIQDNPEIKLFHSDEIWIRNGKRVNQHRKHQKKGGWIFQHCLPLCAISPSSVVIHQSVFDEVGLFDEDLPACEDYDLWLRITHQYPVIYTDQPLIEKYGGHEDQLSRKYWGMDKFRITSIINLLENHDLNVDDRKAACRTLVAKLHVYLNGARKRNKAQEVRYYQQLLEYYSDQ